MKYYITMIFLALLVGCTSKTLISPQAKEIKQITEKPKNCRLLGKNRH